MQNADPMDGIDSESVDLVVTSPPYPMIQMWDQMFGRLDPQIHAATLRSRPWEVFERMHRILDAIWYEVNRILKPGGFACINIGDATRTLNGHFALFTNHARILNRMIEIGFTPLPAIIWRKQTNAPTKFMGSGMLPAGAYVTLEHEYILVLRKSSKRPFATTQQKQWRRESAYFWEERNLWFSDVWMDLKGASQSLAISSARKRSAAFPLEIPYRLINMYSVKGDVVLDPFMGTGTTAVAAIAAGRHSIGFEIEPDFKSAICTSLDNAVRVGQARIAERLADHDQFVLGRRKRGEIFKYQNNRYNTPVKTRQETDLFFSPPISMEKTSDLNVRIAYSDF